MPTSQGWHVAVQLRHGTPFPCPERRRCLLDMPARHRHRFVAQHFAYRPAVVHPYGNVFPNTGRNFWPFSGKSFSIGLEMMDAVLIMLGEDRAVATS